MIDKQSDNWKKLPFVMKVWFVSNFLSARPIRKSAIRIETLLHISGFITCCLALISDVVLPGGLMLLGAAYSFHLVKLQGDKYAIWYDEEEAKIS